MYSEPLYSQELLWKLYRITIIAEKRQEERKVAWIFKPGFALLIGSPGINMKLIQYVDLEIALIQQHWVVGSGMDVQHVLHGADKLGVGLRGNHPLRARPGLECVFLSVMRTHSGLIASTTANSTNRSASSRKVQFTRPSGGAPRAKAIRRASWAPSSLRYGRPVGFVQNSAAASPSSTNARRTRYTVKAPHSTASVIRASSPPGPSAPASALSKKTQFVHFLRKNVDS